MSHSPDADKVGDQLRREGTPNASADRFAGKGAVFLTPAEWAEAEALWVTGEYDLKSLSKRFGGIRVETLSRRFKKRGLVKGSKALDKAVKQAVIDAATDVNSLAYRAKETKEQHYNWAKTLAAMGMQRLAQAKQAGQPMGAALNDLRAINEAMRLNKMAREERWMILGLDKENSIGDELPELVVRELAPDEVNALRTRQVAEETDFEELLDEDLDEEGGEAE